MSVSCLLLIEVSRADETSLTKVCVYYHTTPIDQTGKIENLDRISSTFERALLSKKASDDDCTIFAHDSTMFECLPTEKLNMRGLWPANVMWRVDSLFCPSRQHLRMAMGNDLAYSESLLIVH
ncbi:hypothetical protein F4808DRAFT_421561 [Astrocystis sublimbata]|nr:hypothetical protein F4808DRAFT_421561 [Astrocystis sublimbata]